MEVARIESSLMNETVGQVWILHFPYSCFVLFNIFYKRKGLISFSLDKVHLLGAGLVLGFTKHFSSLFCSYNDPLRHLLLYFLCSYLVDFATCMSYHDGANITQISICLFAVIYITFMFSCVRKCLLLVLLLVLLPYLKGLHTVAYFNVLMSEFKASKY